MALSLGSTTLTHDDVFFLTKEEREPGQKQWLIKQIRQSDGMNVGQFWLDESPQQILIDPHTERIYVGYKTGRIVAVSYSHEDS